MMADTKTMTNNDKLDSIYADIQRIQSLLDEWLPTLNKLTAAHDVEIKQIQRETHDLNNIRKTVSENTVHVNNAEEDIRTHVSNHWAYVTIIVLIVGVVTSLLMR